MIYCRLYIQKTTKKILICEADQNPIDTSPVTVEAADPENAEECQLHIVHVELEHLKGYDEEGSADNFVESEFHGSSIFIVNDDLTVSLNEEGAKGNKGVIKSCSHLRIRKCEVIYNADQTEHGSEPDRDAG